MADTIREYLVSLGFTVDEAKLHRFQDALSGTARSAAGLSAEVIGVGFALTEMVERVARHFEDLYYMSQRTGATVSGLDAIGFAARQVGLSADQARGAVEGMAAAMRLNPGARGMAEALGATDPQTLVERLKRQYGPGGYFAAARQAQSIFGVDEQVFQHYWMFGERLRAAEEEHRRRMREAGVDLDKDKERWVIFTRQINDTGDAFQVLANRIADDWRPSIQGLVRDIGGMAESFNRANASGNGILGMITSLIAAFGGVTAIFALLGKLFGFKTGVGLKTLGAVGLPFAAMELMGSQNEQAATDLRTSLRQLLGIEDPKEPLPWAKGGSWGVGGHAAPRFGDLFTRDNLSRPPVKGTSKVWGDDEAVAAGLYEGVPPRPRPQGDTTMHINQTNNINGAQSPTATAAEIKDAHRELGDALRNMYQKVQ